VVKTQNSLYHIINTDVLKNFEYVMKVGTNRAGSSCYTRTKKTCNELGNYSYMTYRFSAFCTKKIV
jgi:hypothetical protein